MVYGISSPMTNTRPRLHPLAKKNSSGIYSLIKVLNLDLTISIFFTCYSFDLRNKNPYDAKPWSSPTIFKNRATFVAKTQPALLIIDTITLEDETVYRCRVDFQNSPTRNSKVNLTVIGKCWSCKTAPGKQNFFRGCMLTTSRL